MNIRLQRRCCLSPFFGPKDLRMVKANAPKVLNIFHLMRVIKILLYPIIDGAAAWTIGRLVAGYFIKA
jgi:hypothetical protein